jgi:hypothetical protein
MNAGTDPNTTSAPARPVRPLDLMVAACLIGVALFELAELHLHLHWAGLVAGALLVVFVLVGQARLGLRERYLLALAAAATLAALVCRTPPGS